MKTDQLKRVYFIGIGGIGMSALARHFASTGCQVGGYDKTPTDLTRKLEAEGMFVTHEDTLETLDPAADLVVYTPAVPSSHLQLNHYRDKGFQVKKRAAVLGWVADSLKTLAVAGSHGKTSTSALLNHMLQTAGYDCSAFLGGISIDYNSNYVHGSEWAVAEADEYDRSFHLLHPYGAIVTAVDTDHLDVYGDFNSIKEAFRKFTAQVRGKLVHHHDVPEGSVVQRKGNVTYGFDPKADFHTIGIEVRHGRYHYDVMTPHGVLSGLVMHGGGRHNVENSLAALALARTAGVEDDVIRAALATYRGVERRFQVHIHRDDLVYIDDYAHHPREIEVTLATARELYPGRRMTVVFQPHLYSRTRDLADGLARSLSMADEVVLLDIYPAREAPIEGVSSGVIYRVLKKSKFLLSKNQVITVLNDLRPELLLTIGAGDIDTLVRPIKEKFDAT